MKREAKNESREGSHDNYGKPGEWWWEVVGGGGKEGVGDKGEVGV